MNGQQIPSARWRKWRRYRGHFYNWYDTKSLKPLFPKYISQLIAETLPVIYWYYDKVYWHIPHKKIQGAKLFKGLRDTLRVLTDTLNENERELLEQFTIDLETACNAKTVHK